MSIADLRQPPPAAQSDLRTNAPQVVRMLPWETPCPNPHCGCPVDMRTSDRGSDWITALTLLPFLLPGIVYHFAWRRSGTSPVCTKCGRIMSEFSQLRNTRTDWVSWVLLALNTAAAVLVFTNA
jgi:hypothetical protein